MNDYSFPKRRILKAESLIRLVRRKDHFWMDTNYTLKPGRNKSEI